MANESCRTIRLFGTPVLRYSGLRRDLPSVSHKMLTQHLRKLERDGLVARVDNGEQPPLVEYGLSRKRLALEPLL